MKSENVNRFNAIGRVAYINNLRNGGKLLTLFSKCGKTDVYPQIYVSDKLNIPATKHGMLYVSGFVNATKDEDKIRLVATDIREAKTLAETYFEEVKGGNYYPQPEFRIFLAGVVNNIRREESWQHTFIEVNNKTPQTFCVLSKVNSKNSELEEGVKVAIVCSLSTVKDKDDKSDYTQRILLQDIAKL